MELRELLDLLGKEHVHLASKDRVLVFDRDKQLVQLLCILEHSVAVQFVCRLVQQLFDGKFRSISQSSKKERKKKETNDEELIHFEFVSEDFVLELEDHGDADEEVEVGIVLGEDGLPDLHQDIEGKLALEQDQQPPETHPERHRSQRLDVRAKVRIDQFCELHQQFHLRSDATLVPLKVQHLFFFFFCQFFLLSVEDERENKRIHP